MASLNLFARWTQIISSKGKGKLRQSASAYETFACITFANVHWPEKLYDQVWVPGLEVRRIAMPYCKESAIKMGNHCDSLTNSHIFWISLEKKIVLIYTSADSGNIIS